VPQDPARGPALVPSIRLGIFLGGRLGHSASQGHHHSVSRRRTEHKSPVCCFSISVHSVLRISGRGDRAAIMANTVSSSRDNPSQNFAESCPGSANSRRHTPPWPVVASKRPKSRSGYTSPRTPLWHFPYSLPIRSHLRFNEKGHVTSVRVRLTRNLEEVTGRPHPTPNSRVFRDHPRQHGNSSSMAQPHAIQPA